MIVILFDKLTKEDKFLHRNSLRWIVNYFARNEVPLDPAESSHSRETKKWNRFDVIGENRIRIQEREPCPETS